MLFNFSIAFLIANNVRIFCWKSKRFLPGVLKLKKHLEPLGFHCGTDENYLWTVWNKKSCKIEVRNCPEEGFLNCSSKPKLFKRFSAIWAVVGENYNVILYDGVTKAKLTISKLNHGLSQVNNICLESEGLLMLADYRMGICLEGHVTLADSSKVSFCVERLLKFEPEISTAECVMLSQREYYAVDSTAVYDTETFDLTPIIPKSFFATSSDSEDDFSFRNTIRSVVRATSVHNSGPKMRASCRTFPPRRRGGFKPRGRGASMAS